MTTNDYPENETSTATWWDRRAKLDAELDAEADARRTANSDEAWTREVTIARRQTWNDGIRAIMGLPKLSQPQAVADLRKRLGFDEQILRYHVQRHGL